ncbi:PREDICTED: uncharacterized protein LOC108356904 [Rhagoletis zephyria]|uniref:uncharacterized protein LOC108356904 n=1 Tax=Rhagoletis zephyria TaxID=28612 RepID=UPI00081166DB|nr:PREDICTED: uncharacterized protein LOC108356904 [Rhagoletis zephyria]
MMSADYEDGASKEQLHISLSVRKKVSIVWRYFEKLDRLRVRCRLCGHKQNYQGTTGNILRHLKNKHNIDATLKGQKTNTELVTSGNQVESNSYDKNIQEESCEIVFLKNESTESIHRHLSDKSAARTSVEGLDPYSDSTFQLYDYTDESPNKNIVLNPAETEKYSVEEERLLAEIEYFREKAGYYKMQKNLVALQAKKIKYELGHL